MLARMHMRCCKLRSQWGLIRPCPCGSRSNCGQRLIWHAPSPKPSPSTKPAASATMFFSVPHISAPTTSGTRVV